MRAAARVVSIDPARDARWDAFVRSRPDAQVYHLGAWAEVLRRTYGFAPRYLATEQESELTGVLPLMLTRGLSGRRLRSLPAIGAGGPVARSPDETRLLLEAACRLTDETAQALVVVARTEGLERLSATEPATPAPSAWIVHEPPSELESWKKSSPRLYRTLRKADAAGVVFRESTDPRELKRFYRYYLPVMRRRRSLPRPYRQFVEARRLLEPAAAFKLFAADLNGRPVAYCVCHPFRDTVDLLYSASDSRAWVARPNHTLWWGVIRWAAERGFAKVDLGIAQPDSGLAEFKRQFLAVPVQNYRYDYPVSGNADQTVEARRDVPPAGASPSRQRALEVAWEHAPLPLTRIAGALVYRWA